MINKILKQNLNIFFLTFCFIGVCGSYFMEYFLEYEPCIICLIERYILIFITSLTFSLLFFKHKKMIIKTILTISSLLAILALYLNIRLIWLQNLPKDNIPPCLPPLEYMLDNFSIIKILQNIFTMHGDCSNAEYIFGVSIAWWTVSLFVVILSYNIYRLFFEKSHNK